MGKERANGNVRSVAVGADKKGKRKEVENRSSYIAARWDRIRFMKADIYQEEEEEEEVANQGGLQETIEWLRYQAEDDMYTI